MSKEKSCRTCGVFAELKEPFERSDGAVIYGYCFKDGDKDYSPNMGKGYPVFVDGGGGACKQYKRRRAAFREQEAATKCSQSEPVTGSHQLEPVTNRNGLNGWISVEDRLPEEQDSGYLVIVSGKPRMNITLERAIQIAYYYKGDGWVIELFPEWESPEVTHWMPLPEPPEVQP